MTTSSSTPAIARSLVLAPKVLLLDEPLSNLDVQLRVSMRHELKSLQRDLGITAVYVTHDQEEALALSDRVAVLNAGTVQQIGSPRDIYFRPETEFVCTFVGESTELTEPLRTAFGIESAVGKTFIRPQRIHIDSTSLGWHRASGVVKSSVFLGGVAEHVVDVDGMLISVRTPDDDTPLVEGSEVSLSFPPAAVMELAP